MNTPNWFVITGGPSSGKTTLINELGKLGYITYPEAARAAISRSLDQGKSLHDIQKKDFKQLQKKILQITLKNHVSAPKNKIVFFDRGLPDIIAYDHLGNLNNEKSLKASQNIRYKGIFLTEPLPFEKDSVRIEDQQTAIKINRAIRQTYQEMGYNIISLPPATVSQRLEIIFTKLAKLNLTL